MIQNLQQYRAQANLRCESTIQCPFWNKTRSKRGLEWCLNDYGNIEETCKMHGINDNESFAKSDCGLLSGIKPGENLAKPIVMSVLLIAADFCLVMQ